MDLAHFGLRQRPFPTVPDTVCYYPATAHEDALNLLRQGVADGEGFLVLTGEPGTGKTLVAHKLLERLGDECGTALITNSHCERRADLLQAVLYDLGLPYDGRSEQELRLALTDQLLARLREGRRTVLIVDEAHHLSPDLLEELRLLGNLESRSGKAVQVVLIGQPALLETLCRPELAALAQRFAVRVRLDPLDRHEAADYVSHHLRVAGARPEALITGEALDLLARGARGVPRLLNQSAACALRLTWRAEAGCVDVEGALEALATLGLDAPSDDPAELTAPAEAVTDDAVIDEAPATFRGAGWPSETPVRQHSGQSPRLVYAPGRSG